MGQKIIVAMDGGAGTGTSSAAEGVAAELGIPHLNCGSLFRAVAWEVGRQGIDPDDGPACQRIAESIQIDFKDGKAVSVDGRNVENELYGHETSQVVARVSRHPNVRREIIETVRAGAAKDGAVVEGRAIGSDVFPDAQFKFFFTCDPVERVKRLIAGGRSHETEESLLARDGADQAREFGKFIKTAGAIEIDTTHLSRQEVVAKIVGIIRNKPEM